MISFVNSFLSYLMLLFVIVAVAGCGLALGLFLRKRKEKIAALEQMLEEEELTEE